MPPISPQKTAASLISCAFLTICLGNSKSLGEVSRIGDEDRRNEMYRRAMGAWMSRDATAANAWLSANPLPESVTRSLSQDEAR